MLQLFGQRNRRFHTDCIGAIIFALALPCCSGDESDKPQEPVAPSAEATPYPEDPDLAKGDALEGPQDGTKSDESKGDQQIGALADQPFPDNKNPSEGTAATDSGPDTPAATAGEPTVRGDADSEQLQGAFNDNQPNYQPAPGSSQSPTIPDVGPASDGNQAGGSKAAAEPGKIRNSGKRSAKHAGNGTVGATRYVDAVMLNVRSKPNSKAPIVRRLLGGATVKVEIRGKWAKIKNGQWLRAKYLSEAPTRNVSKEEADAAWKTARKHPRHHSKAAKNRDTAPATDSAAPPSDGAQQ